MKNQLQISNFFANQNSYPVSKIEGFFKYLDANSHLPVLEVINDLNIRSRSNIRDLSECISYDLNPTDDPSGVSILQIHSWLDDHSEDILRHHFFTTGDHPHTIYPI